MSKTLIIMVCPECKYKIDVTVEWLLSPPNICPGCGIDMTPEDE